MVPDFGTDATGSVLPKPVQTESNLQQAAKRPRLEAVCEEAATIAPVSVKPSAVASASTSPVSVGACGIVKPRHDMRLSN